MPPPNAVPPVKIAPEQPARAQGQVKAPAVADQPQPAKEVAPVENAPAQKPEPGGAKAADTPAPAAPSPDESGEGLVLRDISFKLDQGRHEKVFITLSRQATPVLSSIQNEMPRIVADFKDVSSVRPGLQNIEVNGVFIKRIRSSYNAATRTARVVVDLDIAKNYFVNPVYSQKENIFAFDIAEDTENPSR